MGGTAALFSGQGSQFPGMGKDLYEEHAMIREIYECAGDILGFDVAKVSFEGSEAELSRTAMAQPVIYTMSIAAFEVASRLFTHPAAVAGHSLGEYAALYAAGAFSLEDGFRIIGARARAMETAVGQTEGAMWAVLKVDEAAVQAACDSVPGLCMAVNFNCPGQTVLSGEVGATDKAATLLREQGAKTVRLDVAGAFHTPIMQPAADLLREQLQGIAFQPCTLPFYSNLTGDRLEIQHYPDYLTQHLLSPVLFTRQIAAMIRDGIDSCVEFGPKKTVATLAKKNNRSLTVTSVENLATLEALPEFLLRKDL